MLTQMDGLRGYYEDKSQIKSAWNKRSRLIKVESGGTELGRWTKGLCSGAIRG